MEKVTEVFTKADEAHKNKGITPPRSPNILPSVSHPRPRPAHCSSSLLRRPRPRGGGCGLEEDGWGGRRLAEVWLLNRRIRIILAWWISTQASVSSGGSIVLGWEFDFPPSYNFGRCKRNPFICPTPKHRSKIQLSLTWTAVPLCMGGVGVRGFSRPIWEGFLLKHNVWGCHTLWDVFFSPMDKHTFMHLLWG
jgi:hypothetical protein